jgi:hypothetical protein
MTTLSRLRSLGLTLAAVSGWSGIDLTQASQHLLARVLPR